MSDALSFDADRGRLSIQGELTIYQISEATKVIWTALDSGRLRQVDLGAVTDVDTAALQLLLLLKRQAGAAGEEVQLINHSRTALDAMNRLGVAGMLDAGVPLEGYP